MKYFSVILTLLVLASCGIRKTEVIDGYAHLRELPVIKPKYTEELTISYKIYEASDTHATCFVEIDPEGLLSKRDSLDKWSRNASMQLLVKKNAISKEIIYQGEKVWSFQDNKPFIDSFHFDVPKGEDIWFEVTYSDLNKHTYFQEQRWWIRKKQLLQQHFTLLDAYRQPIINSYCQCDTLALKSDYFSDASLEFLLYGDIDKPANAPFAFSSGEPDFQKPDSIFRNTFSGNRLDIPLKDGFLLIRQSSHLDEVAGFFACSADLEALVRQSMTYICSATEVEKLKDPAQSEQVFNQFWARAGGNDKDRTEKLKQEFVRRVQYSNQHFSSYKPGCLTDRGMIYIVYGEPERMLKEGFQEIWAYKASGIEHINFVFVYDQDQIAPNNCYLERSQHYKSTYYISVENWRNGLIPL